MRFPFGFFARPPERETIVADRVAWRTAGALMLVAILFALITSPGGQRSVLDPRASSFRATPHGSLGLFLLLEELEVPTARRTTALVEGDPLPGALALLAPTEALSPAEVEALLDWVDRGGKLIYAAAPGDTVLAALGLVLDPVQSEASPGTRARYATPDEPHRFTAGVARVYAFRYAFADSSEGLSGEGLPLLRLDGGGAGLVLKRRGSGSILAWSDAGPLANHSLRTSGAAVVFARAAEEFAAAGGALHFDEFHHGFRGGGSPARAVAVFVRDTAAGRMSLQLGLAGVALLILLGRRFGAPHAPAAARRRSPLEHLHALAGAYQAGNARNRARHLILTGVARRLGRRPPAPGQEVDFLTRLGAQEAASREAAEAMLVEWRRDDRADLTTLARQADRLVMEARAS